MSGDFGFEPHLSRGDLTSRPRVPWGLRELIIGVVALLISITLLSALIILPAEGSFGAESGGYYLATFITTIVWHGVIFLVIYQLVSRKGGSWRDLGLRSPAGTSGFLTPRLLGIATALSFAARIIVVIYVVVVGAAGIDWLEPDDQIPDEVVQRDWLLPVIGLSVVLTAPIAEELLFRGFVYGGVRRYLPVLPSALLSGALFSAAHFQAGLFIPFLLIGALFAYAYERTGSLYMSIAVHGLFNLVSFLLLALVV